MSFPNDESLITIIEGFQSRWNIPQCADTVDGIHIPIIPPTMNHTDYYNHKGWYSVITQTVIIINCSEICTLVGQDASMMPVFPNSTLYYTTK